MVFLGGLPTSLKACEFRAVACPVEALTANGIGKASLFLLFCALLTDIDLDAE